jgi:hypothetical protein
MVMFEVPADGVRSSVESIGDELAAELQDQLHDRGGGCLGPGERPARALGMEPDEGGVKLVLTGGWLEWLGDRVSSFGR